MSNIIHVILRTFYVLEINCWTFSTLKLYSRHHIFRHNLSIHAVLKIMDWYILISHIQMYGIRLFWVLRETSGWKVEKCFVWLKVARRANTGPLIQQLWERDANGGFSFNNYQFWTRDTCSDQCPFLCMALNYWAVNCS